MSGAVLFAGYAEAPLADTWNYDGTSWSQINVTGPSERDEQSMAALAGNVVLFGGTFGDYLADTWVWDGQTWSQRKVVGPSKRAGSAMGTLGNKVFLYAGRPRARSSVIRGSGTERAGPSS